MYTKLITDTRLISCNSAYRLWYAQKMFELLLPERREGKTKVMRQQAYCSQYWNFFRICATLRCLPSKLQQSLLFTVLKSVKIKSSQLLHYLSGVTALTTCDIHRRVWDYRIVAMCWFFIWTIWTRLERLVSAILYVLAKKSESLDSLFFAS